MAELEWYKESCEKDGGMGYYDTFKIQSDKKDIHVDTRRVKLTRFWDDIIEMWESHELPSDFKAQNKWINAGNTYRKLVEPLDISSYYKCGRPKRYKILEKWWEDEEKTRRSRDSIRKLLDDSLPQQSTDSIRKLLDDSLPQQSTVSIRNLFDDSLPQQSTDRKEAIMRLEFSRKCRHPGSFVTIPRICRFWESDGHNFDIKSLDPTKMTQETYDTLVDIIEFIEISRLHELFLLAIMLCFIAIQIFLGLMVESYDSKAKIQEIEAKIQDKFNYNGNCNVKIGIIPERSGTPFLNTGVLRPTPIFQKVHSTQLVLRLTGAKHISREYDITSIVSKLFNF